MIIIEIPLEEHSIQTIENYARFIFQKYTVTCTRMIQLIKTQNNWYSNIYIFI